MGLIDELHARGAQQEGHWALKSGRHAAVFLQCTPAFADTAFVRRVGHQLADTARGLGADVVVSPAVTSTVLAFTVADALAVPMRWYEDTDDGPVLRRGQRLGSGERVLIVEDVLTTGRTARAVAADVEDAGGVVVGIAAVVDRSTDELELPFDRIALTEVGLETWEPQDCPLCVEGAPLSDPRV